MKYTQFKKRILISALILNFCCISHIIAAKPLQWRCIAKDQLHRWHSDPFWSRRKAMKQVYKKCKAESTQPMSCHTATAMCWHVLNKRQKRNDFVKLRWYCKSADVRGNSWIHSGKYRYKAYRHALKACREKTPFSHSCKIRWCYRHY